MKVYENAWLCPGCGGTFGPPIASNPMHIDLATSGSPGDNVRKLGPSPDAFPFTYEAWVSDDGIVRVTNGKANQRSLAHSIALTPAQAHKYAEDFRSLARAAEEQQERLRGDDRWHVRPHPERPSVFFVRRHFYGDRYTERPFIQTEIRKSRRCDICYAQIAAGLVMYREENPEAWATPNWRDVRICASCIQGQT